MPNVVLLEPKPESREEYAVNDHMKNGMTGKENPRQSGMPESAVGDQQKDEQ